MINFAVFNIRIILTKLLLIAIVVITIIVATTIFLVNSITIQTYMSFISSDIPIYSNNTSITKYIYGILNNEIHYLNIENTNKHLKKKEKIYNPQNDEVIVCKKDETKYDNTKNIDFDIKNNTDYDLNYKDLIKEKLNIQTDKSKLKILIIHTHGSESYTGVEHTDYFRNENTQYNVVRVGEELSNILKQNGYNVIHDKLLYDYPTYNGSYTRTLESIETYKELYGNIDIVLDIHRDAIGSDSDFAPVAKINDEIVSQIMIIVGTDKGGLDHPNWRENLKFGLQMYSIGKSMYGDIYRPMVITNSRYNQHATTGSLILEIGATGNTLEQSINTMKYLANIIDATINNI